MNSFPREVSDVEIIVRGICSPYHVKNGKLRPDAFTPTPESDEVSVMRHDWIGTETCRYHSKKLADPEKGKIYRGMAVLTAKIIRTTGADVIDSREQFLGHADIKHGYVNTIGEPPPAEIVHALRERKKLLAKMANYFADPNADASSWQGVPLSYSTITRN